MKAEVRHPDKFRWNRWHCGRDRAIFHFFQGCRHVGFLKLQILTVGRIVSIELPHHAKLRGDRSNRSRDISILDFWNFKFLTVGRVERVEVYHPAKYRQNRSSRGRDMAIFRFFKTAVAAILDIWNFKLLTVRTIKSVELHHHAKFRQNRSNRGRDMAIFRFLRWRPPPSSIFKIWNF